MSFTDRILAAAKSATAAAIGLTAVAAHADESSAQSVTVLSSADLEARRLTGLDAIAAAVPEISYTQGLNSIDTLSLYMRGAGPVAPGQITLDGAVGVYQDGFYISRLQANTFDLLDLERAEILAGPQGAEYGRDTTGGVINLISEAPAGKLRFNQDVDFGNRNSYRILSSLDTPSWHNLSAKVTLLASGTDGYVNNLAANTNGYGLERQRAARLQVRWDALSNLRAEYFIERAGLDSTPEYPSNPLENGENLYGNYTYFADQTGPMHSTYRPIELPLSTSNHTAQGLTLTWHALPALNVESRTGYRTVNANEQQDYAEFFSVPLGTVDLYNQHQFSQDLRVSGELFDHQLGYTVGATYFKESGDHENDYVVLGPAPGYPNQGYQIRRVSAEGRSQSEYARLFWRPAFLGRHLEIIAAGRYTRDNKDAARSIEQNNEELEADSRNHVSYNRATPEGDLVWHWNDDISTYAKVSTAYQAGGALESAEIGAFSSTVFRPETSTTYEIGLKSAFLGGRLHADVALFDSRRKDVQYALPVSLLLFDDVLDFQRVTVKGASFDLRATPFHDLTVRASGTWLHPSIDRADAPAGTIFDPATSQDSPYVVGQNINNVFALPYTPKYAGSVAADYAVAHLDRKDVFVHLDYVYRSRMFAEAGAGPAVPGGEFDTQPGYGLLNGRITLSQETDWAHRVKFSIWGRNILNRKYYQPALGVGPGVTSYDTSATPAALAGYAARAGAWAEPVTYGLAVRYEY
jgi:iron complex outermembrane receptor protein